MRISDWSSDVCSSDLCGAWHHVRSARTQYDAAFAGLRVQINIAIERSKCRACCTAVRCICITIADGRVTGQARRSPPPDRRALRLAEPVSRCVRSEEHTSELQSIMRISYAVFFLINTK